MSSETPAKNAKATTPAKGKPKRTQKPKAGANQATKQPSAKGPMKPKPQEDNESDEEGDSCFICAEPIVTYAVTPCNHRTCHICALRLRALYKTKNCVFCKTEQKTVIFTKDPTKLFEEFTKKDIHSVDKKLDIQFENELIHQDTILSLEYNCPDPKCDVACDGWAQLKKHVNKEHNVLLCDLCIKNKQIFAHEHTLYTAVQLNKHYKHGDKSFNKDDDSGFKGHPECAFCRISFYGDDELFHHCREKHEQCHICVQNGVRHEYYPNYDAMERHFRKDHYLCMYRECLDKKFIVFSSQLDLTSHEVEEHGASGRVELSFDYGNHEPHRHKNKQRQQRSQAPVPQPQQPPAAVPELQPVSSARLSSDDFPSIGGASSSVNRPIPGQPKKQPQSSKLRKPQGFGGLTTDHWPDLRPNSATPSPSSSANTSSQSTNATFPDASQVQRHAQVLEKLSRMLNGPVDVEQFRAVTTAYRNDSIDITGYVNEIIRLCKNDATKTTAVLKDVEALIDSQTKKQEVLHALRNTEAKMDSFPALSPLTDRQPVGHGTSKRILVIKGSNTRVGGTKSTGKSASGVWNRVAHAANTAKGVSNSSSNSPSSSRPSSPSFFPTPKVGRNKTAWGGTNSSSANGSQSAQEDFPAMTDLFPSLPATSRPHSAVLQLRRNNTNFSNAWSGDQSDFDAQPISEPAMEKKKKGKKGKQVLFRVGL